MGESDGYCSPMGSVPLGWASGMESAPGGSYFHSLATGFAVGLGLGALAQLGEHLLCKRRRHASGRPVGSGSGMKNQMKGYSSP